MLKEIEERVIKRHKLRIRNELDDLEATLKTVLQDFGHLARTEYDAVTRNKILYILANELSCLSEIEQTSSEFQICERNAQFSLYPDLDVPSSNMKVDFNDMKYAKNQYVSLHPMSTFFLSNAALQGYILVFIFWGDEGIFSHESELGICQESCHILFSKIDPKHAKRSTIRFKKYVDEHVHNMTRDKIARGSRKTVENLSLHSRMFVTAKKDSDSIQAICFTQEAAVIVPDIVLDDDTLVVFKKNFVWTGVKK